MQLPFPMLRSHLLLGTLRLSSGLRELGRKDVSAHGGCCRCGGHPLLLPCLFRWNHGITACLFVRNWLLMLL